MNRLILTICACFYISQIYAFRKMNLCLISNSKELEMSIACSKLENNKPNIFKYRSGLITPSSLVDSLNGSRSQQNDNCFKSFNVIGLGKCGIPFLFSKSNLIPNYRFSFVEFNIEKFFLKTMENQTTSILGVGTSVKNVINNFDSVSFRNTLLTFDVLNRTYINKRFYIKMGLSPIFNNHSVYKLNHKSIAQSWMLNKNVKTGLSTIFTIGIGYTLFKNFDIKLNYLYLPNYLYIDKIKTSYLNYGFYFTL